MTDLTRRESLLRFAGAAAVVGAGGENSGPGYAASITMGVHA